MTIQDIGAIGELLAAVATIATLFYLARQVQANTRQAHLAFFSGMVATPGDSRYWEVAGRGLAPQKMVAAVDECIARGAFPELLEKVYPMPDVDGQQ